MRLQIIATALLLTVSGYGQLAEPGANGVAMGHLHVNTADLEGQKKLWIGMLGAKRFRLGTIEGVSMPGAVILFKAAKPSGPTDGSMINHVGVLVPSLDGYAAKLDAAGLSYTKNANGKQIMLVGPDGLKVELTADASIGGPVKFHHIHFYTPDPLAIQKWYVETFGAKAGRRAIWEAADLPGVNLTFTKSDTALPPIAGRALDHIGFEIRDLEAFCKKLEAAGVKFDTPYRNVPQLGIAVAFLTDPWGGKIELTERLGKLAN